MLASMEHMRAELAQRLGDKQAHEAWADGERLTMGEAVALAREQVDLKGGRRSGVSPREREVAALLEQGRTNRQIAQALVISERPAAVHVEHILDKLNLRSRWQVAEWASTGRAAPRAAKDN
jgi:non-specific serine/threonine protein kinase